MPPFRLSDILILIFIFVLHPCRTWPLIPTPSGKLRCARDLYSPTSPAVVSIMDPQEHFPGMGCNYNDPKYTGLWFFGSGRVGRVFFYG